MSRVHRPRGTVPNTRADSAKASVFKAVVRTWYRSPGRPKGSLVAFGDEMHVIISQVDRHLTAQCLAAPNRQV